MRGRDRKQLQTRTGFIDVSRCPYGNEPRSLSFHTPGRSLIDSRAQRFLTPVGSSLMASASYSIKLIAYDCVGANTPTHPYMMMLCVQIGRPTCGLAIYMLRVLPSKLCVYMNISVYVFWR